MQQGQVGVERGTVRDGHLRDRGDDDRRVAEDHREHVAQQQAVQHRVIQRPGHKTIRPPHPQRSGEKQPPVTWQQARGDEAGQPRLPDGLPGEVVAQQPQPEGDQPYPAHPHADPEYQQRNRQPDEEQPDTAEERNQRAPPQKQDARELQSFARDGEHEKPHPPRDDVIDGLVQPPQPVADQPQERAEAHRDVRPVGAAADDDDEDDRQSRAPDRDQPAPERVWQPDEDRQPAQPREQRRGVSPAGLVPKGCSAK